jgi:ribosomal protein S18 acetylase RimI-like enzyme
MADPWRDDAICRAGRVPTRYNAAMPQAPISASELTFRRAALPDVERVVAHVHGAYRGDSSRRGWTTEAGLLDGQRTDKREIEGLVSASDAQLWLIERAQELLGSFVLKKEQGAAAGTVQLGMIAVRPELQAQGIGRLLLEHAEQVVLEQRWGTRMEMTVIAQRKELIAWYERRGYQVTGEQRPFPYGDMRFGLPRRPDLHFFVLAKDLTPAL